MKRKFTRFAAALFTSLALWGCEHITDPSGGREAVGSPALAADIISATGLAKPLKGLREYNGTYTGNPATGWRLYTSLYRDNYWFNGKTWEGEGSGKHGGVDIQATSGDSVFAAQGGQIVYANGVNCTSPSSWGGRITIKSPHPYTPGRYVYYTYAHLNDWDDRPNLTWVNTGDYIGKSGGALGDVCPGFSTGAHLHFQVDNDNDASFPYSPANTNTPDTGFEVTGATFNPMVFIQGGYRWEFQGAGNDEYWKPTNFASWGVSNGAFWMDGNFDPFMARGGTTISCGRPYLCSTQIAAEASQYRYVKLDLYLGCAVAPSAIYFTTSIPGHGTFSANKVVTKNLPYGASQPVFDMGSHPEWRGIITGLRFDPSENCDWGTDVNHIGYIRLVNNQFT